MKWKTKEICTYHSLFGTINPWLPESPYKKSAKFHIPRTSTQYVLRKEHYCNYWTTFINELGDHSKDVATAVKCTCTAYLPNLGAQAGLVLHKFFMHNFYLMLLKNLHHFPNLCNNFWFNVVWHRQSMVAWITRMRLAESDITVIPSVVCRLITSVI
jgi:hypothetical protein